MNIGRTIILSAGLSLMVTAVPSDSDAAWKRSASSGCTATSFNRELRMGLRGQTLSEVGGHTLTKLDSDPSGWVEMQVMCPIEDTSEFPKGDIDRIHVHTYDGSSNGDNFTRAYTCAVNPLGFSSGCGLAETASGSGYRTLVLNSQSEVGLVQSSLASGFFASVRVYMRARTANRPQRFMGYWTTD